MEEIMSSHSVTGLGIGPDTGPVLATAARGVMLAMLMFSYPAVTAAEDAKTCGASGVAVQVLGSGGPEVQDKRASSSYLVWVGGKARVLIDAGGGSPLRFGESGAAWEDLDAVAFTHFHADHSAGFPALMKSSFFGERTRELPLFGPTEGDAFPSATQFVKALFDAKTGAYRYLSGFMPGGGEQSYKLKVGDIDAKGKKSIEALKTGDVTLTAVPVTHGPVPALAWRVDAGDVSITFSGDMSNANATLAGLAKDSDILVAHNAIPEGAEGVARNLHMPPSAIGEIARDAKVGRLILSHRMLRSLGNEAETKAAITVSYSGPVTFADDLDCFKP